MARVKDISSGIAGSASSRLKTDPEETSDPGVEVAPESDSYALQANVPAPIDTHGTEPASIPDIAASTLVPDLTTVELAQLPEKFFTDLSVVREQLLGHPKLTSEAKALRLYSFFIPYAQRFVEIARTKRPESPEDALAFQAQRFAEKVEVLGFQPSPLAFGDRALPSQVQQLLNAESVEAFHVLRQSFEADFERHQQNAPTHGRTRSSSSARPSAKSSRPIVPLTGRAEREPELPSETPALRGLPRVDPQQEPVRVVMEDPEAPTGKRKTGGNRIWMLLQRFRKARHEDAVATSRWDRFTAGAILFLVLVGLLTVLLVNL